MKHVVFFSDGSIGIFEASTEFAQQFNFLVNAVCSMRRCSLLASYTLDESSFDRWFHSSMESCSHYSHEV